MWDTKPCLHALPVGDVGAPAWCASGDFTCPLEKPGTNPCACSWQGWHTAPSHGALHWQAPIWMQLLCVYQGCSVLAKTEVIVLVGWLLALSNEVLMKSILLQDVSLTQRIFVMLCYSWGWQILHQKCLYLLFSLASVAFLFNVICFGQMSSDSLKY